LIECAKQTNADYIGLSFVYSLQDIEYVEALVADSSVRCIPKIEAKESLNTLYEIMSKHKLVIVDRGDLSGEIGIINIWRAQRAILSVSHLLGAKVIMATQFLLNMLEKPIPSIAEVDSLYSLLNEGIAGVQLSEETSIGNYAVEAVEFIDQMVSRVIDEEKDVVELSGAASNR